MDFPASAPAPVPDWWDVLTGPKPIFMNRMYRMRLKQPAQDPATLSQEIRTKHLPVPDPEPVLATLPKSGARRRSFVSRPVVSHASEGRKNTRAGGKRDPVQRDRAPLHIGSACRRPSIDLETLEIDAASASSQSRQRSRFCCCILLLPFDLPTMAAADGAVREAIVKRAAIEHSDDFVEVSSTGRASRNGNVFRPAPFSR